jgi:hypothetical protein
MIGLKGNIVVVALNRVSLGVVVPFAGFGVGLCDFFVTKVGTHIVAVIHIARHFYLGVAFGLEVASFQPVLVEGVLVGLHVFARLSLPTMFLPLRLSWCLHAAPVTDCSLPLRHTLGVEYLCEVDYGVVERGRRLRVHQSEGGQHSQNAEAGMRIELRLLEEPSVGLIEDVLKPEGIFPG